MGATSISARYSKKFDIPEGLTQIKKGNVPIGSIKTTDKKISVEHTTFTLYIGSYSKEIIDDIVVFDADCDDYAEYKKYTKNFEFNIFFSQDRNLLLLDTTTPIAKKFLKELKDQDDVKIDYSAIHFAFDKISNQMPQTKGIRFSSNDEGVNNKSFSGNEVDTNIEASEALESDSASQLIGILDVLNKSRTIMLTQSGTILSFTSLTDLQKRDFPMVELALALLRKLDVIK